MKKRALTRSAFFVAGPAGRGGVGALGRLFALLLVWSWGSGVWAQACEPPPAGGETVQVAAVYDGDTVRLKDGRKVRLIGINTPEMARDDRPAEPLADQARQALAGLIRGQASIRLVLDEEHQDRYGRTLAHLFLNDGRSLEQILLEKGLAAVITVPPNLRYQACYFAAEQSARRAGLGIWAYPRFQGLDAARLSEDNSGFYIIEGRVERLGESRKAYWLNFSRGFAVRIDKHDAVYFASGAIEALEGRRIRVRGWISPAKKQLRMRVRHPAAIERIE